MLSDEQIFLIKKELLDDALLKLTGVSFCNESLTDTMAARERVRNIITGLANKFASELKKANPNEV